MRFEWLRLIVALGLTVTAIALLRGPDGKLQVAIDSSTRALGADVDDGDPRILLSVRSAQRLQPQQIKLLASLHRELQRIPGVRAVQDIATIDIPYTRNDDVEIDSLARRLKAEPEHAERWIEHAFKEPLFRGRLISENGQAAAVLIDLRSSNDSQTNAIVDELRTRTARILDPEASLSWALTGAQPISQEVGRLLVGQMRIIIPATIGIFVLILLLAFRSLMVVAASVLTVAAALLWTLGLAAAFGIALNLVSILIPPLVMTLSVSYAMHVITAHVQHGDLNRGLRIVRLPLVVTAVTTAVGLGALALNGLAAIQQFALLGAAGAAFAAFAADSVLPWVLRLMRKPPVLWPAMDQYLLAKGALISDFVIANSRKMIRAGVLITALALLCATNIRTGAQYVGNLPADNPSRLVYEQLNRDFGGGNSFGIVIRSAGRDGILLTEVLEEVSELQSWLQQQQGVGNTLSLADYVKRIYQAMDGGGAQSYRIPDDPTATKQLLLIATPPEELRLTDLNYTSLTVWVQTPLDDTADLSELFKLIDMRLGNLPPGLSAELSGTAVGLARTIEKLSGGQLMSIGIAMLAIYGVLSLVFASLRVGLMAMLPNVLPIAVYFGLLGITSTPLGPTTALVACLVLGIAVDDTLHLLVRFNTLARERADEAKASREAVAEVIRPITLTTMAVSLGFLTMVISPFHSQVVFGVLAALTLVVAWFSDLFLAPAIAARTTIVTLWDSLRLDLGEDPQDTIPLFSGMSARQSRIFAIAAGIRKYPAGSSLIVEGEEGKEMYVIIDGTVRIWVRQRDGEELHLTDAGRGVTLGEGGSFAQRRTANVTVVEAVRSMVFDIDMLEKLRKRHPRIGALAYRNLNRIQAERLAGTTKRLADLG